MIDINELRPAVEAAGLNAISMQEVLELLDRLEETEADALEQARLNGMGSEREAALMAKLEAVEKDIALKERIIDSLGVELNAAANERDALRAEVQTWKHQSESYWEKIEQMEKQEPIGWLDKSDLRALGYGNSVWLNPDDQGRMEPPYALPGAQPAPSVPEGWKLVPIEVVGLYNFMCAAFVPMTPQQEQIAVQLELAKRAMLAAAPEAKP